MDLLLTILLDDILPIFVVASVGFVLARRLHVDVKSLSRITFNALAPCLVFTLLVTSQVSSGEFGRIVAFTVLLVGAIGLVARVAAIPFRLTRPELAAFLIVVMFSNAGNYGMSVVLFAFGREVLARAAVYFVTSALLMYTVGTFVASSGRHGGRAALRGLVRVPAVWGLVAAALVIWTGVELPKAVSRPSSCSARRRFPPCCWCSACSSRRAPGRSARAWSRSRRRWRWSASPLIGFLLASALGLTGLARQAVLVESAMPSAVITTILALEFDVAPPFVTSVVVVTTLASPLTRVGR